MESKGKAQLPGPYVEAGPRDPGVSPGLVGLAASGDLVASELPLALRLRRPGIGPIPRSQRHVRVRDTGVVAHHLRL